MRKFWLQHCQDAILLLQCPMSKCSMGALEHTFLEFLEQPVKLKIFLVIVNSWWRKMMANDENQVLLNKTDAMRPKSFYSM